MIRTPWSRIVWGPCLLGERACSGPQRSRGHGVCGLSLLLQTPLPPGSHRCPVNRPVARKAEGALRQCSGMTPEDETVEMCDRTIAIGLPRAVHAQEHQGG